MNMYMGYGAAQGPCEGAVLIFANNSKEAKKLFWQQTPIALYQFTDARVNLIKDKPWLEKEKKKDAKKKRRRERRLSKKESNEKRKEGKKEKRK